MGAPGFWDMYGPPDPAEFDAKAVQDLGRGACVRSGRCCLQMPCPVAQARGEQPWTRCSYLRGDEAGSYACQLLLDGDKAIQSVGPGEGCCDPRNLDRLKAGRNQTTARRLALAGD